MTKMTWTMLVAVAVASPAFAEQPQHSAGQPIIGGPAIAVEEPLDCPDPWARFHGFLFRRYAGSVEMESKTPYPKGYSGRFTYLPWKPDWVNTPANELRESQYRHHQRRYAAPAWAGVPTVAPPEFVPGEAPIIDSGGPASDSDNANAEPIRFRLQEVQVEPLP
jgi:hypothetical protein